MLIFNDIKIIEFFYKKVAKIFGQFKKISYLCSVIKKQVKQTKTYNYETNKQRQRPFN